MRLIRRRGVGGRRPLLLPVVHRLELLLHSDRAAGFGQGLPVRRNCHRDLLRRLAVQFIDDLDGAGTALFGGHCATRRQCWAGARIILLAVELGVAGQVEIDDREPEPVVSESSQFHDVRRTAFESLGLPLAHKSGTAGNALQNHRFIHGSAIWLGPLCVDRQRPFRRPTAWSCRLRALCFSVLSTVPRVGVDLLPLGGLS